MQIIQNALIPILLCLAVYLIGVVVKEIYMKEEISDRLLIAIMKFILATMGAIAVVLKFS